MIAMIHMVTPLASPQPTAPIAGAPSLPNMKTQFRNTLHSSAKIDVYMIGLV